MSEPAFVLIVEDPPEQAEPLAQGLRAQGHACRIVTSVPEALDSIRTRRPDVIIADARLTGSNHGARLLKESNHLAPDAEIVMLTPDAASAAEGRNLPARANVFDYLPRPLEIESATAIVSRAAEQARNNRIQRESRRQVEFEGIITVNEHMIRILRRVERVADSKLTVLVLGESGTGKELVAHAVHRLSPRRNKPYRTINCAGLNENLLESELFGHVKGAFTGAVADRKGLFEAVDGGTLFLDEVGDMPMPMQAKLLRALENGEIIPVGSNEIRHVDVRVVAATRRNVREMLDQGQFRDDLFYRLNVVTLIRLPPLRERREDVPLLVKHFIKVAADNHGKTIESINPEVIRHLAAHAWPGNARELRSVIEAMVVESSGSALTLEDLPEELRTSTEIVPAGLPNLAGLPNTAGLTMEQLESLHIANTLKMTGGNREKTAKMLGIGARTLYRKLREYGLQ